MSTMLQYIEQQIRQSEGKPGTLIHIGAGAGSELQEYLDLNFSRIVLYEALPELVAELREKSRAYQQVSVEQAAVAEQKGKVTFHRMNNPHFSSLKEQKMLNEYYPNLVSQPLQMEAVCLTDVVNNEELSRDAINILILEVLGGEFDLLTALDEQAIQLFSWVIIRGFSNKSMGSEDRDCSSFMQKADFSEVFAGNDLHPFYIQYFRRDDNVIALKALQKKYTNVLKELENEKKRAESLDARLAELTKNHQNEQRKIEENYNIKMAEKEKNVAALEDKLNTHSKEKKELEGKLDKLSNENHDLVSRLEKLDEEVSKAEAQLELIKDVVIREKAF